MIVEFTAPPPQSFCFISPSPLPGIVSTCLIKIHHLKEEIDKFYQMKLKYISSLKDTVSKIESHKVGENA
jgi:hypothetical protein